MRQNVATVPMMDSADEPRGPGSDADHATHMHVDTKLHGASDRYRICE